MIEKKKSKCGYLFYEMTLSELREYMFALGLCDSCNSKITESETVYLIPVLNNRTYCKACFERWNETSEFFIEDIPFEREKEKFLDVLMGLKR